MKKGKFLLLALALLAIGSVMALYAMFKVNAYGDRHCLRSPKSTA